MVDAWSGPAPTPQEFTGPSSDGVARALARMNAMSRELGEMRSNLLKTAGLSVEPDRLRVLGDLAVDGSLSTAGATVLGGDVAITGTLSLPAGIIDNDALANPITHRSAWSRETGFALPSTWTEYTTVSLTVPAGFTRMQFTAIGVMEARNDTGSTQYLISTIWRSVNGGAPFMSVQTRETVPSLYWATGIVPYNWGETVTPGDVHTLALRAWAGGSTWSADVNHAARLEVTATFSRS